jgi:hypothetical protein
LYVSSAISSSLSDGHPLIVPGTKSVVAWELSVGSFPEALLRLVASRLM